MYDEIDESLAFFVLEAGARWPRWGQLEARRREASSVVEAQGADESMAGFAHRVVERVESMRRSSKPLCYAAIITAPHGHGEPLASRVQIARAIVRTLGSSGGGSLILAPSLPTALSDRDRHDLFALAGTLCEGLSGHQVVVSVFLQGLRPSRPWLHWTRELPGSSSEALELPDVRDGSSA